MLQINIELIFASYIYIIVTNQTYNRNGNGEVPLFQLTWPKSARTSSNFFTNHKTARVDCNAFSAVVSFIDPNKSICQLKHVVPKAVCVQTSYTENSVSDYVAS